MRLIGLGTLASHAARPACQKQPSHADSFSAVAPGSRMILS
jgi:hypothetical protein